MERLFNLRLTNRELDQGSKRLNKINIFRSFLFFSIFCANKKIKTRKEKEKKSSNTRKHPPNMFLEIH